MVKISKMVSVTAGVFLIAGILHAQESTGYLGAIMRDVSDSIAAQHGLKATSGVMVVDIVKESPAENGGLLIKDVILKIDNKEILNSVQFEKKVGQCANRTVKVDGVRGRSPFTLPITIGESSGSKNIVTVSVFNEETTGDQADKEGHSREALEHYIKAIDEHFRSAGMAADEADFRVRQKAINLVQKLTVPPATPEDAERAMAVARAAQADAANEEGYNKAIRKYAEASRSVPWIPELYFNLGALCERGGDLTYAVRSFKLYLLASPGAEDAQKVKDKLYLLEDNQKEKEAAAQAAQNATKAEKERVKKTKAKQRVSLSFCYGTVSLNAPSFHWSEKDSFDRKFEGLTWDPGLHIGIEVTPASIYSNPRGNSFVVGCGALGFFYESNTMSPSNRSRPPSVTRIDSNVIFHTVDTTGIYLSEKAFSLSKIVISDEVTFGYRIMLHPILALEPFAGIAGQFEIKFLRGDTIKGRDFDAPGFRLGIPFGARVFLSHFYLGYEWNAIVKVWGGKMMYYDQPSIANSKRETGVLELNGGSYWSLHAGAIF